MLCPHCQAPNADDSRFCGVCGKATSSTEPVSNPHLRSDVGEPPAMIGREIAGRYRIQGKLGEGGMGTVYKAEQISLKRTVAIKLLRPDVSASALLLRRFNAEAAAVAKLRHHNTVTIYDFGQDTDGSLFIAMELIEGRSLRTVIHHEAPLPIQRGLAIAAQVAASLGDAHAKTIIHRDLKPDNVMLTDRGRSKDNVTVLDFGIAKLRDETNATQHAMTQAGDMLGTPQYMAPEQIRAEQIDGRTDVYALGCMLYEMFTARLPYEGPTVMALLSKHLTETAPPPSQRRPDLNIPPMIDELIMTAMAKDPAHRPMMEQYGERIAAILATMPPGPSGQLSAVVGVPNAPQTMPQQTPQAYSAAAFAPPTPPPFAPPTPPAGFQQQPAPQQHHHPGYPPQYAPQPTGTPQAQQTPFAAPPPQPASGGKSTLLYIIIALLVGGAGVGIYFVTRGKSDPGQKKIADGSQVDPDKPDPDKPDPDKPDPMPVPDPKPPEKDEWDGDTKVNPDIAGEIVDVGQGVKLIVPPGFPVQRNAGGIIAGNPMTLAIVAGPIDGSTNPDQLAQLYAKSTGLTLSKTVTDLVAGKQRKVFMFAGTVSGVPVIHTAVPIIGPGYRIAVIVHMPALAAQNDPQMLVMLNEILTRRIIVPGAKQ